MNDLIKGDTSLIKDLTDELNRLQTKVAELTNNLNIVKLELVNKEQQRLDTLNDNKYYKNLCLELTCSQRQIAIAELVNIQKYISDNAVGAEQECFARELNNKIDQQIQILETVTNK